MAKTTKKAPAKKSTKKQSSKVDRSPSAFEYLAYGMFAVAMVYGFASWAIDTGSLWLYFFCFVSVYFATIYLRKFFVKQFLHNDKTRSNKRA